MYSETRQMVEPIRKTDVPLPPFAPLFFFWGACANCPFRKSTNLANSFSVCLAFTRSVVIWAFSSSLFLTRELYRARRELDFSCSSLISEEILGELNRELENSVWIFYRIQNDKIIPWRSWKARVELRWFSAFSLAISLSCFLHLAVCKKRVIYES